MVYLIDHLQPVTIGRLLDGEVYALQIDCSAWIAAHPQLDDYRIEVTSPSGLVYLPAPDAVTMDENGVMTWIIRQSDTATAGDGMYQIVASGPEGTQRTSAHPRLTVLDAMPGTATDTPPDPSAPWVEKVLDAAARAEDAADRAEEAAKDYDLPTASATVKGGVKVGPGLEMDGDVLRVATYSDFANSKNYGVGNNENEIVINCKHFRGTIAFIGTTDCSGEACIYCGDKLAGAAPFTAKANVTSIASFRSIMIDGRKYIEVQASDSPNTTFCGEIRRTISSIEEDAAYNKIIVRATSGTMPANSRMMFEWE